MDAQPPPPDPTLRLPGDTYYQIVHTLRGLLPPPVTDTPEDLARRDNAAIARIASLLPGNADEANIAACYVAADAYAMDLLRLARESRGDPTFFLKCTTRATGMMREARAARSALTRVQAERRERDADSAAADRAAWAEHCAIGLMMDALGEAPPAVTAESPPPTAHPPAPDDEPATDAIAAAERHAIIQPRRSAPIPVMDGLPPNVMATLDAASGPHSPEPARGIVAGDSSAPQALDT